MHEKANFKRSAGSSAVAKHAAGHSLRGGNRLYSAAYLMRSSSGLSGAVMEADDPYNTRRFGNRDLDVTKSKKTSYQVQNIQFLTNYGDRAGEEGKIEGMEQAGRRRQPPLKTGAPAATTSASKPSPCPAVPGPRRRRQ